MFFEHLTLNRQIVPTKHAAIEIQIRNGAAIMISDEKMSEKLRTIHQIIEIGSACLDADPITQSHAAGKGMVRLRQAEACMADDFTCTSTGRSVMAKASVRAPSI